MVWIGCARGSLRVNENSAKHRWGSGVDPFGHPALGSRTTWRICPRVDPRPPETYLFTFPSWSQRESMSLLGLLVLKFPWDPWKKQLEDPNPSYLEGLQPPVWIDPFGSQTSLLSSEVGAGRALGQSEGPGEPGLVGAQHHAAAGAGCAGELPRSLPRIRIGRRGTRALTENALCGRYKDRFLVFRGGGRGGSREI